MTSEPESRNSQLNVLLVEDDPSDAGLIHELLAEHPGTPIQLRRVDRLAAALGKLGSGEIDGVLLDLNLPDSKGLETFTRVYAHAPGTPIIVLTGLADETLGLEAVRSGAQDYLVKGRVDGPRLVRTIRYAIERKQADRAIPDTKEFYEQLVGQAGDAIVVLDPHGIVLTWNAGAERMFGWTAAEVLARPYPALQPADVATQIDQNIRRIVAGETLINAEIRRIRKDGTWLDALLTASPVRGPSGAVIAVQSIIKDITERKQAEEALRESERRLREALEELKATQQQVLQQERLRALGQMASGIAHDFNNALSPIMGFSELLLDVPQHLSDKDKATRYLKIINTAAKDAASIVRRLREFYRTRDEDEHLIPISLNQIARHAISLTQPRWKDQALAAGITVRIATDLQTVPLVVANESEIREALLNMIFNSVDAMPQGGTITIRTRSRDGSAELEVSDTGTGMTEEVRGRCLEPFFSTKGEHGTGLGLAMVYGIIQRHHGRIDIDSEPGRGTTVTLRLPIEAEPEVKDKTQEAVAPSRRFRILVVDDEPLMCEVLTEYLTRDGHTVETAANGREGLEKFHRGWFDVVITDRGMPEMSGDQMAASIKRTAPTKPVILLTGFGDLILAAGEKPAGIDSVISKPVTAAALRKALADIIP